MFLSRDSKKFLRHFSKNFPNHGSKKFLNHDSKRFLIMVAKGSLIMLPKSIKSSLIKKLLHTYKPFFNINTTKSTVKIKTLKKIKSKFEIGQLKSAKSPVQLSAQSLIFVYPIMRHDQIRLKILKHLLQKF